MSAETAVKETVVTPKAETTVTPQPKQDIISKISKIEPAAPETPLNSDLDQIKDPVARKLVEEKIKNLEKGFNQKFMSLADEKKALADERAKMNQPWTPERLKQELSRPDFVQATQILQSERVPEGTGISQEQWSFLTPEEKSELLKPINDLKREVDGLKSVNQSVMRDKIDTTLKAKWEDYEPSKVDQFFQAVNERRLSDEQLIEMSWKALNFDRYIERAHKLGLEGRHSDLQEKINGSSFSGTGHTSPQEEPPKRTENESSQSFFKRLADWRSMNRPK
jgi:hypothetical protein